MFIHLSGYSAPNNLFVFVTAREAACECYFKNIVSLFSL